MFLLILSQFISCTSSDPENKNASETQASPQNTQTIKGKIMEECQGLAMIDVMDFATSENEPVFFTKAKNDSSFSLQIPSDRVSQIHGFCYPSQEALDKQSPSWKMTPKQIHPAQIPEFLELYRLEKEPPKAESSQIENREYLKMEENRQVQEFFEEFYGQRLSEKQAQEDGIMMGSYPSRNYSHISTKAFYQYVDALYALIKQHAGKHNQGFLIPNETEWKEAKKEQNIYGAKTVTLLYQLQSACQVLEIPCPSWRMVRSEELSILDKTILSMKNTQTKQAAFVWIIADHMAKEAMKQQIDPLPYLPHPLEISVAVRNGVASDEWKIMAQKLATGYQRTGLSLPNLNPEN